MKLKTIFAVSGGIAIGVVAANYITNGEVFTAIGKVKDSIVQNTIGVSETVADVTDAVTVTNF